MILYPLILLFSVHFLLISQDGPLKHMPAKIYHSKGMGKIRHAQRILSLLVFSKSPRLYNGERQVLFFQAVLDQYELPDLFLINAKCFVVLQIRQCLQNFQKHSKLKKQINAVGHQRASRSEATAGIAPIKLVVFIAEIY